MEMVNSKGVSSSRDPLWVAAFFFKKLKKAQVLQNDICSSVDKILHEEMDVVSYRVLAYLLLGVVKIYSKKVEFLLHDCNDAVMRMNTFVTNTMLNAPVESLRMTVTIPDSLELDAIDLGIPEESGSLRDHIAAPEEITLKEVLCETGGLMRFSQEKFEDFDFGGNTCFADYLWAEDVHQSHLMNMDFDVLPSNSPISSPASKGISQNSISSEQAQQEPMDFDTILMVEEIQKEPANLFAPDQQTNEDQTVQEVAPYEDEICKKSRISQEESMDTSMFPGREKEVVSSVEASNESYQVDGERNMAKETSSSSCQMHHEIVEVNDAKKTQESIGRPEDDQSYQKESVPNAGSSVAKESLEELNEGSIEGNNKEGNLEFRENISLEDGRSSGIPANLINLDVTPQSRSQGGSIGRPKPGKATSASMPIPTPATRECAHFSKKIKSVIDDMTVLPHEEYRKSLHDTSDLVSKRKKNRRTLPAILRKSRISKLRNGFYESLLPCYSSELKSLFSNKKLKIPGSLEIVETLKMLDVSESQIVDGQEHIATAPETPPQCQNVKARSMQNPEITQIHNKDDLGPSSPQKRSKKDQPLESNNNLMEEFTAETSSSYEEPEREQFFNLDEDLDLMNEEEMNSCDTEDSKSLPGWSERTRKVARCLQKAFQDTRKEREQDVVNFSQVAGGRTRKECARLFSEMLVLKSTCYVEVQQSNAYGDIAIRKLPKLDETFGVDDLLN